MAGLRPGKTLFEAVPALGAISAHGGGMAKLLPVGFDHPGIKLTEGVNRIGRDPSQNHHVVASSHISRCHCEILVDGGQIWVKDLGSHNGTFVNRERVETAELNPGDELGLSRRVTLVLAMDQDLQQPIDMEVELEDKTEVSIQAPAQPPPVPARGSFHVSTTPGAPGSSHAGPPAADVELASTDEPDPAALLKQVEQQRNVLAILYQISLRCLLAGDQKEIEQLLTNVLQRLVPLDAGFILYQSRNTWRASICPDSRFRPADATVKAMYQLAVQRGTAVVLDAAGDLAGVGLQGGSAMIVPMMLGETLHGVISAVADTPGIYTPEILDIMQQLANVSAAALRER